MALQEKVRRVNAWFATVIIMTVVVLGCYLTLEYFISAFSSTASTMSGRPLQIYQFITGNIYMVFVIFALIILAAVIKIFLWPSKPSTYQEYM